MNEVRRVIRMVASVVVMGVVGVQAGELAVKDGESVAFLGDSITEAGANSPMGYVRIVTHAFEANGIYITPIHAGISGHKSNDMLNRLDRDVLSKDPDWMTLSCGVNDVWHGANGVPLDAYKQNITKIVERAQVAGVKVMLLTSTMIGEDQPNANNQKLIAYNAFLRSLAKEKNCLLADLNADMQAAIAAAEPDQQGNLLTTDGVHMNPGGNVMMAVGVLKAFGMNAEQLEIAKHGPPPGQAQEPPPHLIFFFGDSITKAGGYFKNIRAALNNRYPGTPPNMHNFGHMSETASNLSEAYHPGRRPCILNWVGAVVAEKANLVTLCYGINDGIYHPFNEDRFTAYKDGIEKLIKMFNEVGTYVVVFTPPPFAAKGPAFPEGTDAETRKALLAKANAEAELAAQRDPNKFGYRSAYPYYDEVMAIYSDWVLTLDDREGVSVVNIRKPMLARINETHGGDAIHPNGTGHAVMAETFMRKWPSIKAKANAFNKAYAEAQKK